jgi:hypothetical protein
VCLRLVEAAATRTQALNKKMQRFGQLSHHRTNAAWALAQIRVFMRFSFRLVDAVPRLRGALRGATSAGFTGSPKRVAADAAGRCVDLRSPSLGHLRDVRQRTARCDALTEHHAMSSALARPAGDAFQSTR